MKTLISMRQALFDPDIFNAGDPSWLPWNVLSIVAMGEPLESDEERAIFTTLTGLHEPPGERVDEYVALKGRRSGGTTFAARILVYLSALCDYTDVLSVGERGVGLFLATTTQQADIAFARAAGIINASSLLRSLVVKETKQDIVLSNGVDLSVRPASARSLRGVTLVGLCADEACHFYTEGDSSDAEVLGACRPALATTGGLCLIASSPWRAEGEVFELHRDNFGRYDSNTKILVSRSTSRQTNATLSQAVIDRAMARDPIKARCEFYSEFRTDISDYVPRKTIEDAVDIGVVSRPPMPGVCYAAFADAASGISPAAASVAKGDTFTMAIGHRESDAIIVDLIYAKQPPFNASAVVTEISAIAKTYSIDTMVSDRYSAGFMQSELQRNGMAWQASAHDKSGLYSIALPLFTSGRVRLPDDKAAVEQFCLLERKPTSGNRDRIDARGGRSEDSANAVAGVLSLLTQPLGSADNWLEFYRRIAESEGITINPGPDFGFAITPAAPKVLKVEVPVGTSHVYLSDGTAVLVPANRIITVPEEDAKALGRRGWKRQRVSGGELV